MRSTLAHFKYTLTRFQVTPPFLIHVASLSLIFRSSSRARIIRNGHVQRLQRYYNGPTSGSSPINCEMMQRGGLNISVFLHWTSRLPMGKMMVPIQKGQGKFRVVSSRVQKRQLRACLGKAVAKPNFVWTLSLQTSWSRFAIWYDSMDPAVGCLTWIEPQVSTACC